MVQFFFLNMTKPCDFIYLSTVFFYLTTSTGSISNQSVCRSLLSVSFITEKQQVRQFCEKCLRPSIPKAKKIKIKKPKKKKKHHHHHHHLCFKGPPLPRHCLTHTLLHEFMGMNAPDDEAACSPSPDMSLPGVFSCSTVGWFDWPKTSVW